MRSFAIKENRSMVRIVELKKKGIFMGGKILSLKYTCPHSFFPSSSCPDTRAALGFTKMKCPPEHSMITEIPFQVSLKIRISYKPIPVALTTSTFLLLNIMANISLFLPNLSCKPMKEGRYFSEEPYIPQ